MSETVRVEIDGDLFLYVMQDKHDIGTVQVWLSDKTTQWNNPVLPRRWCTEWVGGDYKGTRVTGVYGGSLAVLLEQAKEWAYQHRDNDNGEFGNERV